jgi:hypothetical protein
MPTVADRECRVDSTTDPYGDILGFLDRNRYFGLQTKLKLKHYVPVHWRVVCIVGGASKVRLIVVVIDCCVLPCALTAAVWLCTSVSGGAIAAYSHILSIYVFIIHVTGRGGL